MTDNTQISEKVDRIEAIIAELEDGNVSIEEAQQLRDEGKELLEELEGDLDLGDGSVIEQ